MRLRVGIIGVSGYGGGEALRLCAAHPAFELVYAGGESSVGQRLGERYPGLGKLGELVIEKWDPAGLPKLDVLFASLPTGQSKEPLSRVAASTRIVDIGGDHRYVDGWTYGLADVGPTRSRARRGSPIPVAFPRRRWQHLRRFSPNADRAASDHHRRQDRRQRRGPRRRRVGDGYGEVNEDLSPYGLLKHVHMPEIAKTIDGCRGRNRKGWCSRRIWCR